MGRAVARDGRVGVLLLILPTEGRGLGVAFAFFLEEKKDLTY